MNTYEVTAKILCRARDKLEVQRSVLQGQGHMKIESIVMVGSQEDNQNGDGVE